MNMIGSSDEIGVTGEMLAHADPFQYCTRALFPLVPIV